VLGVAKLKVNVVGSKIDARAKFENFDPHVEIQIYTSEVYVYAGKEI